MGAPEERLQDESYVRFTNDQRRRPIVLYTSTNDGFLHAFKVASNDPTETDATAKVLGPGNNELWAFAPPAVLPSLYSLYPFNQQALLDGVATVSDVVAIQPNPATTPPTVFERGATDAQGGGGTWRTVLVQGFGGGRGGYFALDVTNPVPNPSDPENTDKGGPRFLWQLTRDASDNELFGRAGGNPTIATLFFDPLGGSSPREIPVAILPGGPGTPRSSVGGCPEAPEPARTFAGVSIGAGFAARGRVNCYNWGTGDVEKGARSLTIVRLDTGEIIRHFRQKQSEVVNATLRNRTTEAEIDSPITGQPVAFPGRVGAVADRVIVGDQDGRLWKVNVASANPAEWTMTLFFDLYPASILAASGHDFDDGQRVSTPPVLSVDELGNMTVNAATGDQDTLGYSPSQVNYVFSLKEKFDLSRTTAQHEVNWFKTFANGERVVGPLVLFNTNLYFATFLSSDGSNVCDPGTSKVHGMQYITPDDPSNIQNGGEPAPGAASDGVLVEKDGAVIFGVSLAKQPTCFSRVDDDVGNDLIGYQGQTTITQVTPAKFELVMHTSEGSGSPTVPGPAEESIELVKPSSFARVVSWASIIE
jgi:type IV pilus assembly protein PilY1